MATTALSIKDVQLKKQLNDKDYLNQLKEANVFKLDVNSQLMYAAMQVQDNSVLQNCKPESIKKAILKAAATGLSLDPVLGQAYLIPRKGEACFDPSYKGWITVLHDMESVRKIEAHAVYEGDEFDIQFGTDSGITHKPYHILGTQKGKLKGAYAVATLHNGEKMWEYKPLDYLHKIRDLSASYKHAKNKQTTIWVLWEEDMAKKTIIRYLVKYLPKMGEQKRLSALVESHDETHQIPLQPKENVQTASGTEQEVTITSDKPGGKVASKITDKLKDKIEDAVEEPITRQLRDDDNNFLDIFLDDYKAVNRSEATMKSILADLEKIGVTRKMVGDAVVAMKWESGLTDCTTRS